jgi:hypothetical protein
MAEMPKEIRRFKFLFVALIIYQAIILYTIVTKQSYAQSSRIILTVLGVTILLALWLHLYYSSKILWLNGVVKIKPWVFLLLQILLTSRIIIPELIIPLYIWIKSKKLLKLDAVKTYDDSKFMLRPK